MSKPADFMLGVLDFFAVLLPGAVATWLLTQYRDYLPDALGPALTIERGEHASVAPWVVYSFTSYALGHFVFMAGSQLDPAYDRWRERTKPKKSDVAFQSAKKVLKELTPQLADGGVSVFKWARTFVAVHGPSVFSEIERVEASSKFFRSMVVVSALLFAHFLIGEHELLFAGEAAFVCALSFSRYLDQRWKATELTFTAAVVLRETSRKRSPDEKTDDEKDSGDGD